MQYQLLFVKDIKEEINLQNITLKLIIIVKLIHT